VCVIGLALLGLAVLNEKSFGVSPDGKVLLKTLHVYVGYVFVANLLWRLLWAFIGGKFARWSQILPFGRNYVAELRNYLRGIRSGSGPHYLGHNPIGRMMISLLLLLLFTQAVTGLVLAGTDLYKPPFGGIIAEWVTGGDSANRARLVPGSKEFVDQAAYDEMRAFRKPIVTTHEYLFYILLIAIALHVAGVVVTEVCERSGLVSAMISGEKVFHKTPVDSGSEPSSSGKKA
jgi:cytochrome b